ncbi:MAG: DUF934 domain-containing protein [Betaproteobacteria bacterium]|nr:DUF934 domain-containing protein [Betaproteobacteria bacterium]
MPTLINQRQLLTDQWVHVDDAAELPALVPVLVSLARWQHDRLLLAARQAPLGVLLSTHHTASDIAEHLHSFGLVTIHFPKFTDGRDYSIARTLRERFGYRGELRAAGNVLRDQLFNMARVGFNAFLLRDGQDVDAALAAFRDFSKAYQVSVERPIPLFRRRAAVSA